MLYWMLVIFYVEAGVPQMTDLGYVFRSEAACYEEAANIQRFADEGRVVDCDKRVAH